MIPATEDDWILVPPAAKDWAAILAELLREAEKARAALASSGDRGPQRAVRDALNSFVRFSPDKKIDSLKKLDALASETAAALFEASVDASLQKLAANGIRLAALQKEIERGSAALKERNDQIRLAFVNRTLDRAQGIAADLNALGELLGDVDKGGKISKTLKTALAEIEKLQGLLAETPA